MVKKRHSSFFFSCALTFLIYNKNFKNFLFKKCSGDQGNKWVKTRVSVGRRYVPFYINITATVGGGAQGDIALDEITFKDCGQPPPCTGNDPGKFM